MLEDRIDELFASRGPLARSLPAYERREEQLELARAVARNIERGGKLMAEAGTGIGKTLAYLAPVVLSGARTIISTGTKNLQEQLVHKDVPLLARALGRDLDVEVMKGRTNYLCHLRADRFAARPLFAFHEDARRFAEVSAWRERTDTGDRAELRSLPDDAPLWRQLSATSEQCLGAKCRDHERCFVTQMRRRAQACSIVIVNHHLYFADLSLRERLGDLGVCLLPQHDLVVFDEAHELDEVAAQHFGCQVSARRVDELLQDGLRAAGPGGSQRLRGLLDDAQLASRELFVSLPGGRGRTALTAAARSPLLTEAHRRLDEALEALESELASSDQEDGVALAPRAALLARELSFVLGLEPRRSIVMELDEQQAGGGAFVRYVEAAGTHVTVVARPIDVAPLVESALRPVPAVFVSATLTAGGSFAHFQERTGLAGADELVVGSPFDFERNARLYLPRDLPLPDRPEFAQEAAERAAALVRASGGGAFVLCTSHRMLPIMRDHLESRMPLEVLMQGEAPRGHLIERFRASGQAVLVATMSFWQGVDVPGKALRLVVIDKLPFASPGDPVLAARLEHLRRAGRDPFRTHQLPQAALLLRQGFGRLIRSRSDRGLVAILDRRITGKAYGALFIDSLPRCPVLEELHAAEAFLAELSTV